MDKREPGPVTAQGTAGPVVDQLVVRAYEIATDGPGGKESDGTLEWDSTTLVVVELRAGDVTGLGYTYASLAAAHLIEATLKRHVLGKDPRLVAAIWRDQMRALRNVGQPGVGAMAVSAVDIALWDLKAKLLGLPLYLALGAFRDRVELYASGGFCNYPLDRLVGQITGWAEAGLPRGKIKISRHPEQDAKRLSACRQAVGDTFGLMTDSNGALGRKDALQWCWRLRENWKVEWFEEPLSSQDRVGLRLLRDAGPGGLDIAAGEYGFVLRDFADLLEAGAVDCLQADVTRCAGITGLLQVAGLCSAHAIDLSAHCAPMASVHAFCAVERVRHLEYFHDHVRIERLAFDGALSPVNGMLRPDPVRPGLGIKIKRQDLETHLVCQSPG